MSLVTVLWLAVNNTPLERPQTTYAFLKCPSLLEHRSQRLSVYKFLGLDCFMLISFTLINLEISIDNDF